MSRKNILILISVFTFVILIGGVSYSYFTYNKDVGDVSLTTGDISINLSGVNGDHTFTNVIPLPDTDGKVSNSYFDFTVNSTVDTERIYYEVYLLPKSGNTLDSSYIKTYLTDQSDNELKPVVAFNSLENSEVENGKSLYRGIIETNNNGTTRTETKAFRLRLWVDESFAGQASKTFNFDVYLYAKNVDDNFSLIPTIASCPDCKFVYYEANVSDPLYTTWNMAGYDDVNDVEIPEAPSVLTSGLYDDYNELINVTGKNYFLGVKLNSSNQVTNAYVCGVKGDVPFCIEGTSDGSTYSDSKILLQGADLYNNTCTVTGNPEHTACGPWDNSGSVSASSYSDGHVTSGVAPDAFCLVFYDGYFGCYKVVH